VRDRASRPGADPVTEPADERTPGRRRAWSRTRTDRVLGGVAGGLGRYLGVDPVLVRTGFVVLAFAGGVGLLLYGVLWVLTPDELDGPTASRRPTVQQAVALGLITLGVLLLLRGIGLWFGDALVWPVVLGAAGSAIVWTRGDDTTRSRLVDTGWGRLAGRQGRVGTVARAAVSPVSPTRIVVGTVLVALAVAGFLAGNDALAALRDLALALLAAAAGAALLFGPWLSRVLSELGAERRERVRQEERAELAAHLHDSVLQTLALIQRSADDPRRIATLARVQERELRAWLYGSGRVAGTPPATLTDAVEQVAAEVETLHHLAVDVVVVGDAPVGAGTRALLGAIREATTNAAKHAEVDEIAVYVEVGAEELTAFVRDRGVGFDVDAVLDAHDDGHRRGLRDSIVGRLERHGGRATVWSTSGEGTEVELCVPRDAPEAASAPGDDVSTVPDPPAPEPPS
jgi:phage shock protein PspC (stress-responsive transcriptional regulator)/two-component sensor histidine kinase